jgi:hypothetical protein
MSTRGPVPLIAARATDAIELRRELAIFWSHKTWLQLALARQGRRTINTLANAKLISRVQDEREGEVFRGWMQGILRDCDLYWVSPEMTALLMQIAPSMPDVHARPPVPEALVIFSNPIPGTDSHSDTRVYTAAYLWGDILTTGIPCTEIETFAWREYMNPRAGPDPDDPVVADEEWRRIISTRLVLTGGGEWPKGVVTSDFSEITPTTQVMQDSLLEDRKLMAAFWALCEQRITVETREQGDRYAVKRAARAGVPSDVRVIKLRKVNRKKEEGVPQPVNWSHRWIVGWHWRQQYYPSAGEHRAILIHSYVKGPPNRPLVVKEGKTVRALVR